MRDPDQDPLSGQDRFQKLDPRTQEEVGGILERAFRREGGRETLVEDRAHLQALADEAMQRSEQAERLASEANEAARHASERYALTHHPDDLEAMQHWEAEASSYRRQAEMLRQEAEQLKKHIPG